MTHDFPLNFVLLLSMLSFCAMGCDDDFHKDDWLPVHPVSGKLLVDGKPAYGAKIVFFAIHQTVDKPPYPQAKCDQDGSFCLTSYVTADGAPIGDYKVTVVWREIGDPDDEPFSGPDRLKGRYAKPNVTTLKAAVKEGENKLPPFQLRTR